MKRRGLMLLLLSARVLLCHLQSDGFTVRSFHAIGHKKDWSKAQSYCREKFTDLATIQDATQHAEIQQTLESGEFWIGLFKSSWTWSQDNKVFSTTSFSRFHKENDQLRSDCAIISRQGKWFTKACEDQNQLVCYSVPYDKHYLVQKPMNWSEAQTYCRSRYTDLSSVLSQEDNQELSSLLQHGGGGGNNSNAWIGLHRNVWMWSDGSRSSYRPWADQRSEDEETGCVTMSASSDWIPAPCKGENYFVCYRDVREQMSRLVKIRLSGGSADMNDPPLQDAILRQLQQQLVQSGIRQQVELRWRIQPDGRVFHREEEQAAPPGDLEQRCDTVDG